MATEWISSAAEVTVRVSVTSTQYVLFAKSNVLELNVQLLHWFDELSELVMVQISVSLAVHLSTSYSRVLAVRATRR